MILNLNNNSIIDVICLPDQNVNQNRNLKQNLKRKLKQNLKQNLNLSRIWAAVCLRHLFKTSAKLKILIPVIFLIQSTCYSQNIVVRGIISDRDTGQGLYMANITLQTADEGIVAGTTSDGNGLYQFNRLQPETYVLTVRYVGYEISADTLEITGWEPVIVHHVRLVSSVGELEELVVTDSQREDISPGQLIIRPDDFRRAPTPAGSADLVSYIQTQPGVVATGDRGGQLFVRGGTPSENLVLMDGILVYQPFHIVGFFSVFPEDVISRVSFHAGGFGPKYSGRSSSVMDVSLKNGHLFERNWSASLSPFVSDLFVESPLKKGSSSVMVSLRGSLIEEFSDQYLQEKQPLRFNSQLVKLSSISGAGLSCSALFLRTYDRGQLDFDEGDFFKWNNVVSGGHCAGVSEGSGVSYIEMNFGLSYFSNETGSPGSIQRRYSDVFKSNLDFNFTYPMGDWRMDFGFFANYSTVNYDISGLFISLQESEESLLSAGGFTSLNIPLGNSITVEPGFSFTSFPGQIPVSFEPRIQASWQPRGRTDEEVHAAAGIYRQPMLGITDNRDAGNAFTAWMFQPDSNRRIEARHFLLGWRQPIGRFFRFSAEGYYKQISDTPVSVWSSSAQFTTSLAYADGTVRGVDMRLDLNYHGFYMGAGYGYSVTEYVTEQDHFITWFGESRIRYNPPHDRRHQLNARTGIEIGNFSANISWMYGTGLPFTRPLGFDSYYTFEERPPDVTGDYGNPRIIMDRPFEGKFPDYHRLDISLEQKISLGIVNLRVQGGAINAYDRVNLFYYDVFDQKGINQLPLMPYMSVRFESK
jgi:hypothetical protein